MNTSEKTSHDNLTAEELLRSFLSPEVDLIEIERIQSDLILHYMHPNTHGYPSQERAEQVLDQSEMMMKILRQIWDFGRGGGVRRW